MPNTESLQLDESVWQVWLSNNRAKDKLRFAKRLRILSLAAVFLSVGTLVWRLTG